MALESLKRNMDSKRGLTGKSRTQQRIDSKLGVVHGGALGRFRRYRTEDLDLLDKYLSGTQYDHLMDWDAGDADTYIPIRKRKPRIVYNFAKTLCERVASKLVGEQTFPQFRVEDDPDTEMFFKLVAKAANLQTHGVYAVRRMLGMGAHFVRFFVTGAALRMEQYNAKHCYPAFDDAGELTEVEIRYVYSDPQDIDERGRPRDKWFRMLLSQQTDILYDNPDFEPSGALPVFTEVSRADHALGFVQGEWFRTTEDKHSPDGESLIGDEGVRCFIDSINYSLSQSDQAVAYAQEPQLAIAGMDVDEIDSLVKSSTKAWNLGREGEAKFVEADLSGVERAGDLRDRMQRSIAEIARVVMLDPEKIVGSAQSAKAMEVLHGPLVDLVTELRPMVEKILSSLLTKMAVTLLILNGRSENEVVTMPPGWQPQSMDLSVSWPPIFAMTMEDLQKKVGVAVQVANATLVSRETMMLWLAADFGIENIEEEKAKLAAQPVLNPFGAF